MITEPVMYEASSLHSHATARPISTSGSPYRPNGLRSSDAA
jgi:hypothetical protein